MSIDWTVDYLPGDAGILIAGPQRCVLLLGEVDERDVREVWPLVASSADMLDLLQVLTGTAFASLPGAAVLVEEPDGPLVLLRGVARAAQDGSLVAAHGRYTWAEVEVPGRVLQLGAGDPASSSHDGGLPLVGGVVRCAGVRVLRTTIGWPSTAVAAPTSREGGDAWSAAEPAAGESTPSPAGDESAILETPPSTDPGSAEALLADSVEPVQADVEPVEASIEPVPAVVEPAEADLELVEADAQPVAHNVDPGPADEPEAAATEPDQAEAFDVADEPRESSAPAEGNEAEVTEAEGNEDAANADEEIEGEPNAVEAQSDGTDEWPEDDYDRLFGMTSLMERQRSTGTTDSAADSVEAAGRDGVEAEVLAEDVAASAGVAGEPDAIVDDVPSEPSSAPSPPRGAGLIDAVPGMIGSVPGITEPPAPEAGQAGFPAFHPVAPAWSGGAATVLPPAVAEPAGAPETGLGEADVHAGDHDGRTVLRPSRGRGHPQSATVRAIVCPAGHANPPEAVACRSCSADIGDVPIQTIARPVMGMLRFLDSRQGTDIQLDRGMIIGRKPHAADSDSSLRLVRIEDPEGELSRNHARITLEGWHVLVTDLGSTNGTVLEVPGHAPVRLRRGEGTPISPGTVVVLADSVRLRFEVQV